MIKEQTSGLGKYDMAVTCSDEQYQKDLKFEFLPKSVAKWKIKENGLFDQVKVLFGWYRKHINASVGRVLDETSYQKLLTAALARAAVAVPNNVSGNTVKSMSGGQRELTQAEYSLEGELLQSQLIEGTANEVVDASVSISDKEVQELMKDD